MFIKRDGLNTIKSIVERNIINQGYTKEQFFNETEPYIENLTKGVQFFKDYLTIFPDEQVTIVGDYDSDGINSTAILYWGLKAFGVTPKLRLPRRFSEGYGLSEKIIDEIDSGLLITVDNGIAALPAIKKAKDKGLSVIVIDHHLPPVIDGVRALPCADVIIDPHVNPENSDFEDYCGGGLAYRFVKELLPDRKLTELLVLASLATVTDVMPLYGANRYLVRTGLEAFNRRKVVPGMKMLMDKLGMDEHQTEDDYGFKIGPCFNASGRLYDNGAERVLRLLVMNRDDPKISFKANNIVNTNEKRKEIARADKERVYGTLTGERPIVVYDGQIGEGIIGLVAGSLTEDFYCPSIVFTDTENEDIIKGSGRSIPEIHLKNVLDKIQQSEHLLCGYGGHAGAAGLSIKKCDLEKFTKAFKKACGDIPVLPEDVYYDMDLDVSDIPDVVNQLKPFAPYGEANPKISFRLKIDVNDSDYRVIGDGTHFMIKDDRITLMGFGLTEAYEAAGKPVNLDLVGYLSESWYKGKLSYKFEISSFAQR